MMNSMRVIGAISDQISEGLDNAGMEDGSKMDTFLVNTVSTIIFCAGIIAVVMIIIGSIHYVTSQGDVAKTKKARDTILYSVIGLVVAISSFMIVNYVLKNAIFEA